MGSKRGAAVGTGVLDAPEEDSTLQAETARRRLSRKASSARPDEPEMDGYADVYDEPAFKRQGSLKLKVRTGLPRSWIGRSLFAFGFLLILVAAFAAFAAARSALLHDNRFVMTTSEDVQTVANHNVTRAQVLTVFGGDLERSIFRVPLEQRRSEVERLPWVSHATVMRLLPNHIRVAVTERTPVAFVRHGSQIGLVDAGGVLLDMPQDAAGDPHYSFPVLTGLSGTDPLSTRAARMAIYQRFMQELGRANTGSISEVDVSNPEDVKAIVSSNGSDILVHFGDQDFLGRYQAFEQHLPDWKQQYPKLAAADMRYERQVVLEMQPGTGVPVNGDAGPAASSGGAARDVPPGVAAQKPVVKAANVSSPAVRRSAVVHPVAPARPKPATSAGKAKTGNGKIFADLAAARRAEQVRAKRSSAGAGAGAR